MQPEDVADATFDDLRFVLDEINRFGSIFANLSERERFEYLIANNELGDESTIPSPGGRKFIVGRAAHDRFARIVSRELAKNYRTENPDFHIPDVARHFRQLFSDFFLAERRHIDDVNVALALDEAVGRARNAHVELRYDVPCMLTLETEPPEFVVGPIHFRTVESYLDAIAEHLSSYQRRIDSQAAQRSDDTESTGHMIVRRTRQFYRRFPWVASVHVPRCHAEVSRKRAIAAVDAALDVLRLFFPPPYGARLRRGDDDAIVTSSAGVSADVSTGEVSITLYERSDDAPGWLGEMISHNAPFLADAGEWLVAHVGRGDISDLQRRYLDALHWYGQAVSDDTPHGRIVKIAAALERLTVARERVKVTNIVTARVALLTQGFEKQDFRAVRRTVEGIYKWRHRLMHGAHSPYDPELTDTAATAEALTRWAMFTALAWLRRLDNAGKRTNDELEAAYEEWLRHRVPSGAG